MTERARKDDTQCQADTSVTPRLAEVQTVFLDRDGVINRKPAEGEYVLSWAEFEFLPGVRDAVCLVTRAGLRVIVVTNQRGVARGLLRESEVQTIHRRMTAALAKSGGTIDGVYYCPHNDGECDCRKPNVGLFRKAQRDFPAIDFAKSVVIGDSLADIGAGNSIGSAAILIEDDPNAAVAAIRKAQQTGLRIDAVAPSLLVAFRHLLAALGQEARAQDSAPIDLGPV